MRLLGFLVYLTQIDASNLDIMLDCQYFWPFAIGLRDV